LPKIFVILLFSEKIENKSFTFGAPKLYHNFGARVKFFLIGVFPYVVFWQHGTILAPQGLARFLLLANSVPAPFWGTHCFGAHQVGAHRFGA
jgi:hypothetical protein